MRWAMLASLTRNARATCAVVRPPTARRVERDLRQESAFVRRSGLPDCSVVREDYAAWIERQESLDPCRWEGQGCFMTQVVSPVRENVCAPR